MTQVAFRLHGGNEIVKKEEDRESNRVNLASEEIGRSHSETVMKYIRLFADAVGESHFEDVEIEFADTDYTASAPPLGLSSVFTATQFVFMNAPAGWESDWHPSSTRNFFVLISGEWEVTASDRETRRFGPQGLLLVEDTTGKGHKSRVVRDIDSLAVMLTLAE